MNGIECDSEFLSFVPIERIEPVEASWGTAEVGHDLYQGCFVFADWAINCWDYAIQLQGTPHDVGRVFRIEDVRRRSPPIASSFSAWVSIYLRDPELLHPNA